MKDLWSTQLSCSATVAPLVSQYQAVMKDLNQYTFLVSPKEVLLKGEFFLIFCFVFLYLTQFSKIQNQRNTRRRHLTGNQQCFTERQDFE
jgi:hypothetical protein